MSETQTSLLVIGAGLSRTGTLSMKKALEIIYSQPCYHGFELVTRKQCDIAKWQTLVDEVRTTHCEEKIHRYLSEILVGYVAVTDVPSCAFYKELMSIYPNAKVVLTVRDKNDWLTSFRQVIMPKSDDPSKKQFEEAKRRAGVPVELDKLITDSMKLALQKDDLDFDDDVTLLECYEKHMKTFQENIPSERLLVHRFADGWEPLCRFLNVDIPANVPYPKTNQRSDLQKLSELLKKCGSIEEVARKHPGIL
ncbi:putative nad dependent epimerase/dehydratase [Schistosoma mansoni]|uniref:putative nad dependent epimerase/dehydratase n=1 Tax=Schistosoma mansoni TaxID=6183 RepID=UPI00022DC390|nr:putative nad dependent epimerase/dehydratase [Schistosoma mansoni]|eukprot:XP_018652902.1 putative nad dependent epimerase/dehydratase [Schistosoma mansoni]